MIQTQTLLEVTPWACTDPALGGALLGEAPSRMGSGFSLLPHGDQHPARVRQVPQGEGSFRAGLPPNITPFAFKKRALDSCTTFIRVQN